MRKFKKGDHVREIGKSHVMTVEGDAGLAAVSTRPGQVVTRGGMVVYSWVNNKGRGIQKSFVELELELVQ